MWNGCASGWDSVVGGIAPWMPCVLVEVSARGLVYPEWLPAAATASGRGVGHLSASRLGPAWASGAIGPREPLECGRGADRSGNSPAIARNYVREKV